MRRGRILPAECAERERDQRHGLGGASAFLDRCAVVVELQPRLALADRLPVEQEGLLVQAKMGAWIFNVNGLWHFTRAKRAFHILRDALVTLLPFNLPICMF